MLGQMELSLVSDSMATVALDSKTLSAYAPLSSIWQGSDGDLLEAMFKFYATVPPEPILDATYNAGRFWKDSKRNVVSMDIQAGHCRG